jgi:alkylation response protein AidB-like acyl-CoA dehydrogenase
VTVSVLPTAEQEALREDVRRELERAYPVERVRELARAPEGAVAEAWREAWESLGAAADAGGPVERCLLHEEVGRVLGPGALLAATQATALLGALPAEGHAAGLLAAIAAGSRRAAVVAPGWFGPSAADALRADAATDGTGWAMSGQGGAALEARDADVLLLVASTPQGGLGAFAVQRDARGLELEPAPVIDVTRRFDHVRAEAVAATRIDAGELHPERLAQAVDRSRIALAAETVGAAGRCVELTLAWVRERRQFGVPIGSFQAVKHRCADVAIAVDSARDLVYLGADVLASGALEHLAPVASAAKLAAGEALLAAGAAAIQLHGGRGFTTEFSPELFYKRAVVTDAMLGSAAEHRDRVAAVFDV